MTVFNRLVWNRPPICIQCLHFRVGTRARVARRLVWWHMASGLWREIRRERIRDEMVMRDGHSLAAVGT